MTFWLRRCASSRARRGRPPCPCRRRRSALRYAGRCSTNFSRKHAAVLEVALAQPLDGFEAPRPVRRRRRHSRMPMPPPPAVLLSITGIADALGAARGRLVDVGQQAGAGQQRHAVPARAARAVCFRPKSRICSGVGPMKTMPAAAQASAKRGVFAEEAVAGMDGLGAGGSARRRGSRSHVEVALAAAARARCRRPRRPGAHAASARRLRSRRPPSAMPMRRSVRMMRQAISPRLAIRTL